jgi:DNA-binding response OmpR family regulator
MTSPSATRSPLLTALIVIPGADERRSALTTLSSVGFQVTAVTTFAEGRAWMLANHPAVLVTDVRLAEYNGLHLVIRGRAAFPDLASIVMLDREDAGLRSETERLDATFAVKPLNPSELLACVGRTLRRGPSDRTPIRAPFERRHGDRRQFSRAVYEGDQRKVERRQPLFEVAHPLHAPTS